MLRPTLRLLAFLLLAVVPLSCYCEDDDHDGHHEHHEDFVLVGLTVEVLDNANTHPVPGARVTLVSVEHEWSGCLCQSPFDVYGHTGPEGLVRFDSEDFGAAQIGFRVDANGLAVLGSDERGDEVIVALRIAAAGYGTVIIEVPLSFRVPDGIVTVPLIPLP